MSQCAAPQKWKQWYADEQKWSTRNLRDKEILDPQSKTLTVWNLGVVQEEFSSQNSKCPWHKSIMKINLRHSALYVDCVWPLQFLMRVRWRNARIFILQLSNWSTGCFQLRSTAGSSCISLGLTQLPTVISGCLWILLILQRTIVL